MTKKDLLQELTAGSLAGVAGDAILTLEVASGWREAATRAEYGGKDDDGNERIILTSKIHRDEEGR